MELEAARHLEAQAHQDKRITAQVQPHGRSWQMKLTLRSASIGRRTLIIRSAEQWASIKQAWKGL